jgi:hypothetical protein
MEHAKMLNHQFATLAWGALLIWWGIVIMVNPLTIGMGAIGTGLILLGVNAARSLKGIPARHSTTVVGVIALAWGALDQARFMLGWPAGVSFAMMLIVVGLVNVAGLLMRPKTA